MVTATSVGLEHVADLFIGSVTTIALGTGSDPESKGDEALANEVYRQSVGANNISLVDLQGAGIHYAINIKGGLQIPGGTTITEIGLFADSDNQQGAETLVVRDTFNGVELTSGYFSTFKIKVPIHGGS